MSTSTLPTIDKSVNKNSTVLDVILTAFSRSKSPSEKRELDVYDTIEFVNANKTIHQKPKSKKGK